MEDAIPPQGQEVDECETTNFNRSWNKYLDSERCDSMELNPLIRQQIQQNDASRDVEKGVPLPRQQLLKPSTLSCYEHILQTKESNSISREDYEHRIRILENQKVELLKINKQWDQYFRYMKQNYENKESKEELNQELHKIKEENCMLKKENHVLRKRNDQYESETNDLNKVLLQATKKDKFDSIKTSLNPSSPAAIYEDFKTKNEVLLQQVKIYEEDFNKERTDREKIRKEKEELQKMIQKLRLQLQINTKPDYQWYVPGQLPPDVKQKDTGPSLKQFHKPK